MIYCPTRACTAMGCSRWACPPRFKCRYYLGAPALDAATMAQLISKVIHDTYAHWADEPIPALEHKTPRQAIKTSAGLERVKGLLRSYEASEASQAGQQGRTEISYDFLWASLGLTR